MKKLCLLCLVLCLLAAGCAAGNGGEESANPSAQAGPVDAPPEFDLGLTMTLEDVSPAGATVVFAQSGGEVTGELMYGNHFTLEYLEEGVWLPVSDEPFPFTDEAYSIPLGGRAEMETNWAGFYGTLPAGTYRLGKSVMDFRTTGDYDEQLYFAEFTL